MRATLVDCISGDNVPPGAISYWRKSDSPEGQLDGIHIRCPCGCGGLWGASFPRWSWDGNQERPTLSPSLRFLEGPDSKTHWHGFLCGGVYDTCSDSPNRPAGE